MSGTGSGKGPGEGGAAPAVAGDGEINKVVLVVSDTGRWLRRE